MRKAPLVRLLALLVCCTHVAYGASATPVAAPHGMVVTAQSKATRVGVEVLKQNGNAIDAAVAVGYTLAVVAGFHAVAYVTGLLVIRRQERGEGLLEDERDRAINARATRIAYFFLMGGIILVGMIMPFGSPPWEIVNTALLVTVLAETIQLVLVLVGYRRNRLAY